VTPIEQVREGLRVKVVGRLDAGDEPLEAPITGIASRRCAWCSSRGRGRRAGSSTGRRAGVSN